MGVALRKKWQKVKEINEFKKREKQAKNQNSKGFLSYLGINSKKKQASQVDPVAPLEQESGLQSLPTDEIEIEEEELENVISWINNIMDD